MRWYLGDHEAMDLGESVSAVAGDDRCDPSGRTLTQQGFLHAGVRRPDGATELPVARSSYLGLPMTVLSTLLVLMAACGPAEPTDLPAPRDPAACFAQAQALFRAEAFAPEALEPLTCACDGGVAMACTTLATWYREGTASLTRDHAKAAALHERACEAGDGWGCAGLATALMQGLGVPRDPARAVEVAVRGCVDPSAPSAKACSNAGLHLFTGRAGAQDFGRAVDLFDRGCRMGDLVSCRQLQVALDPAGYVTALAPGCAAGDPQACANVGTALPLGSPERSAALRLACDGGIEPSCSLLADAP